MKKLIGLVLTLALGAGLMFMAMNYHVVRANDGHHFIPKAEAGLGQAYVDIREFTVADWKETSTLAQNIANSDDAVLQQEALKSGFVNTAGNVLRGAIEGLRQ